MWRQYLYIMMMMTTMTSTSDDPAVLHAVLMYVFFLWNICALAQAQAGGEAEMEVKKR
jgi:hypothetical protein